MGPSTKHRAESPVYADLQGKTVLITGGAAGIGEAMVHRFTAQGAQTFFCDIDSRGGKRLQKELSGKANFTRVDLTRESEVRSWIDSVGQQAGQIDVLINNAAKDPRISMETMNVSQWDAIFALNIRAFAIAAQQTVPWIPKQGGAIINFSSITHHLAPPEMTAYVATKSGIIGFTRSLARELGDRNIRVNTLSPGWIMTERQLAQFVTPAVKRMLKKEQCIAKLITPDEIADVALFLASDASRAITGQELLADRGWRHS